MGNSKFASVPVVSAFTKSSPSSDASIGAKRVQVSWTWDIVTTRRPPLLILTSRRQILQFPRDPCSALVGNPTQAPMRLVCTLSSYGSIMGLSWQASKPPANSCVPTASGFSRTAENNISPPRGLPTCRSNDMSKEYNGVPASASLSVGRAG